MIKRTINLGNANVLSDLPVVLGGLLRFPSQVEGPDISRLEKKFSEYMNGDGRAFTFLAGRVALAAILDAMDIGEGDEVIIPAYTCVAVPNPVLACGGIPIYADIEKETCNISLTSVLDRITEKTRAVIVQHTFGLPVDTVAFRSAINNKNIQLIEDCTHALGSKINGKHVGLDGDASFFSMEQSKVVSTGTGGLAYSNDVGISKKLEKYQLGCDFPNSQQVRKMLWFLIDLILFSGPYRSPLIKDASYYLSRLGLSQGPVTTDEELACKTPKGILKYRLPNALASVGIAQINRLKENVRKRKQIAAIYQKSTDRIGIESLRIENAMDASLLRYPLLVADKNKFYDYMNQHDIQAGVWFSAPIHPHGVDHAAAGYLWGSCPNAEWAVENVANLPINPRMTDADAFKVVKYLATYIKSFSH